MKRECRVHDCYRAAAEGSEFCRVKHGWWEKPAEPVPAKTEEQKPVTDLYLLREERVPIEELRPGDRIILPSGRRVTFDGLDEYDEGLIVRWWRRAEHGECGHRGGRQHADAIGNEWDGKYLGSLRLMQRGETVRVDRG